MVAPDRVPVADPLGVVPHPVAADQLRAGPLGDPQHPAVDVRGDAGDQVPRRRAEPVGPVPAHQVEVARRSRRRSTSTAWAREPELADHRRASWPARAERARARGPRRARPSTAPPVDVSSSTRWRNANATRPRSAAARDPPHERREHARAGPPGEVEARHRVAVAAGRRSRRARPSRAREARARPAACSQARFSPAANCDVGLAPTAAASRPPRGRTPALPIQSSTPARASP